MITIIQALHAKFPNLKVMYLENRSYGGLRDHPPEPGALRLLGLVRRQVADRGTARRRPATERRSRLGTGRRPVAGLGPDAVGGRDHPPFGRPHLGVRRTSRTTASTSRSRAREGGRPRLRVRPLGLHRAAVVPAGSASRRGDHGRAGEPHEPARRDVRVLGRRPAGHVRLLAGRGAGHAVPEPRAVRRPVRGDPRVRGDADRRRRPGRSPGSPDVDRGPHRADRGRRRDRDARRRPRRQGRHRHGAVHRADRSRARGSGALGAHRRPVRREPRGGRPRPGTRSRSRCRRVRRRPTPRSGRSGSP